MSDDQPIRYQVKETQGDTKLYLWKVVDTKERRAVAFCMRPEIARQYARDLNTKGFIEV